MVKITETRDVTSNDILCTTIIIVLLGLWLIELAFFFTVFCLVEFFFIFCFKSFYLTMFVSITPKFVKMWKKYLVKLWRDIATKLMGS